jgi:uncharacterized protein (TIGR03437 family)
MMRRSAAVLAALVTSLSALSAAEFQSGQAARAVIGQGSFSARDTGIVAHALTVSKGRLYAADANNRILTFDLAKIPGPKDDLSDRQGSACGVCGFAPVNVANQAVMRGVAGVASYGRTVIVSDPPNHHVLIWRDASSPKPDVVLGRLGNTASISANTLIEPVAVAFDGKRLFAGDAALHRVLVWNSLPVTDDQPADAVLGQADFSSVAANDSPGANTLRNPAALVSDGTNLYVADAADRRILIFTPGDTALAADAVVNSASLLATPLAAGGLVTIRTKGQSDASQVDVVLNGEQVPVLSASAEEIQIRTPDDLGNATAGSLYVRSQHAGGAVTVSNAVGVKLASAFPGLYAFGGSEPRAGLVLRADAAASSGVPVTPETPAKPGEVITAWGTGLGAVDEDGRVLNTVSAWVNGVWADVVSAKLPEDAIGVYEIRVLLPGGSSGPGTAQLFLTQAGNASNTITFPVEQGNQ